VVAMNPGMQPIDLDVIVEGVTGGRLEPVPLEGSGSVDGGAASVAPAPIDGGRATLRLPPRTGAVARVTGR
jgi:hypothetical protein